MKIKFFALATLIVLACPAPSFSLLVGVDDSRTVYTLDETSGSVESAAGIGASTWTIVGGTSGSYYSVPIRGWEFSGDRNIMTIDDPLLGGGTFGPAVTGITIGDPEIVALAYAPDGDLYMVHQAGATSPQDFFYLLDPVTGIATVPGGASQPHNYFSDSSNPMSETQRLGDVMDIIFSPEGGLYAWDATWGLVSCDLGTWLYTDVNPALNSWMGQAGATSPSIAAMAYGSSGDLLGIGRDIGAEWYDPYSLFSISLADGMTTKIADVYDELWNSPNILGLAPYIADDTGSEPGTGGSAIPEPSTILLLGTGLLGVAGMTRRRKG